ncbi:MAG: hypothetical protein N5P05_002872 [Chroococcopsis gigantea SAG 12.99]|jgi:methyl coenzyme M reductase gamma subunit|nr:hypothetical protein [Chlorogloea purpurea SAG 13.99]MDV3001266.1 hypothetical protein [Chroococcopsis gigantea SAG 12.99]
MNVRLLLFSGMVTALIGAATGLAISQIERNPSQMTYKPAHEYQSMYKKYWVITGAIAGFVMGAAVQRVRQLKEERDQELYK